MQNLNCGGGGGFLAPHKKGGGQIDQCANISKLRYLYTRSCQFCYLRFSELYEGVQIFAFVPGAKMSLCEEGGIAELYVS